MQFLQQPVLIRNLAQDMDLVVLRLQVQLLPDVEQEEDGIVGTCGIKRVAELKPVLLERADVELLVVEKAVDLAAMARETPLVQIGPYGCHGMQELYIVEMVGEHHQQVFVDAEDTDGIQRGEHVVTHNVFFAFGEGMQIEGGGVGFLKLFDGHHQHGGVDQYARRGQVDGTRVGSEGFAEVGGHRDAALHDVGLMLHGLLCIGGVCDGKRQRVVAHADRQLLAAGDACSGHPLVDC